MRTSLSLLALPIALFVACSDNAGPGSGSGAGGSNTGGFTSAGSMSGGASSSSGGTSSSNGGALSDPSSSGGTTPATSGGVAGAAGGHSGSAGAPSSGADGSSASSGASNLSGGNGGNGGDGGFAPNGGSSGASSGGGSGGGGGAGGGGDANGEGCTRELLKSAVAGYFKALAAHDPSTLPLADNVKFTENGKALKLGEEGLWKTAGAFKYAHSALDTETCSSASQAVVPDGTTDIPVALRLKFENQKIVEIETIAVRPGDYKVSGQNFASNTEALIASGGSVKWEEPVPADQRNTRAELTGWMNKYFRMFPRGVCNTISNCKRIENGGGSFGCDQGASCASGQPSANDAELDPRLILADVETGVGVGFTMFQGNTDMHMFKMYGGKVYGVSAVLGAAGSSGWD